jgi:hypothetical protein
MGDICSAYFETEDGVRLHYLEAGVGPTLIILPGSACENDGSGGCGVLTAHALDALIAPTDGTPPWAIDLLVGDHIIGGCSAPPAMAGYPHVTVPAGFCHGLPVALSFFGKAWQDGKLLGYAFAFEQATQARRTPAFKPTVA